MASARVAVLGVAAVVAALAFAPGVAAVPASADSTAAGSASAGPSSASAAGSTSATSLGGGDGRAGQAGEARASEAPPGEPIRLALIEAFSGSFANAGDAVWRNLLFAVERVNNRGGVRVGGVARPLLLERLDSKGQAEEALAMLRRAADERVHFVLQGNSSTVAGVLLEAIERHNEREPANRMLFLNYSAVDPALTNERCSFWHFRFDAHAGMRMKALTEAMARNPRIARVYLLNQDYSFGRQVSRLAREMLAEKRPDIRIVGDELHPLGRIKDFAPYAAKIKATGADTVVTGNWGNDLTFLVRAAREVGLDADFYTFYGNGLGAPAAIGDAGVGRVRAVAEWHPNARLPGAQRLYEQFRAGLRDPHDDYFNMRHVVMIDMLADALERAGTTDATAVALALEGSRHAGEPYSAILRREDHQLLGPLTVSVMRRAGPGAGPGGPVFDLEGSGFGFATESESSPQETAMPHTCRMQRPSPR